jgi:flagellar assembly protein FliH
MSSSPRAAPSPPLAATPAQPLAAPVPFPYSEVTLPSGGREFSRTGSTTDAEGAEADPRTLAAQMVEREAQARAQGRQQGEIEARAKFEELLRREHVALAAALADFARQRAAYYLKIEAEAVQLALSIARKILHREAQVDPLLLMGVVRVALEKIEGATGVALAVNPLRAEEWRRYLAANMEAAALPQIVEDAALAVEQCEVRTSMGTARMGVEVQLKEIEQGLMDLMAARPGEKP